MFSSNSRNMKDTEFSSSGWESFVTSRRDLLLRHEKNEKVLQFVIGNEAGDADSVVSALVWAYIMQQLQPDKHWIPIVSIPRADMCLRPDIRLLFQLANNREKQSSNWVDSLIYMDDDDIPSSSDSCLTLVDHNRKSNNDSLPSWFQSLPVTQIIDHHADEGFHTDTIKDDSDRNIAFEENAATVGSTCTLVVEKIMSHNMLDWMKDNNNNKHVALILLGVILLDTMNMNPDAGKGTKRDASAIQSLQTCFLDRQNLDDLFQSLQDAKFNGHFWKNELNAIDTLRMDYKTFSGSNVQFGLSSVLLPIHDLLAKDSFKEHAIQYMKDLNISFLGVLSLQIEDDKPPQRELLLIVNNDDNGKTLQKQLNNFLLNHEDSSFLKIKKHPLSKEIDSNDLPPLSHWFQQQNPKGSRKQVAPILLKFLDYRNNKQ